MEQDFVRGLSEDSRYCRFMELIRELSPRKLEYFTAIDYEKHMAFVATVVRDGKEIEIGVARYVSNVDDQGCEFAIVVDDVWQGSGVAGMLMAALMDAARANGLKAMEGMVLASKMLKFAHQLGFTSQRGRDDYDTVRVVREL